MAVSRRLSRDCPTIDRWIRRSSAWPRPPGCSGSLVSASIRSLRQILSSPNQSLISQRGESGGVRKLKPGSRRIQIARKAGLKGDHLHVPQLLGEVSQAKRLDGREECQAPPDGGRAAVGGSEPCG